MDRKAFIAMLNKDLADEHASIVRYLIHAYQVGESTPFGQMLLSTAREEMWHMDWLGDELGEMGGEPEMAQGVYPYDGTSNASLLRSYVEWEDGLIKMYDQQAAQVEEPALKRILHQLGWESITHKRRLNRGWKSSGRRARSHSRVRLAICHPIWWASSTRRSMLSTGLSCSIFVTLSCWRMSRVRRAASSS